MKALNISKPIWQFYFIFGMNVALHRAITIRINNFETNQNGRHAGRFSPTTLQIKTLNISEPIGRIYFIFGTNVALHRAINILTLIVKISKMAAMRANFLRPSRLRKVSIFQNLLRGLTLFLALM